MSSANEERASDATRGDAKAGGEKVVVLAAGVEVAARDAAAAAAAVDAAKRFSAASAASHRFVSTSSSRPEANAAVMGDRVDVEAVDGEEAARVGTGGGRTVVAAAPERRKRATALKIMQKKGQIR